MNNSDIPESMIVLADHLPHNYWFKYFWKYNIILLYGPSRTGAYGEMTCAAGCTADPTLTTCVYFDHVD